MKTMLFNPYTGTPRHPSDIASDPSGILMLDHDEPIYAAKTIRNCITCKYSHEPANSAVCTDCKHAYTSADHWEPKP